MKPEHKAFKSLMPFPAQREAGGPAGRLVCQMAQAALCG